MIGLYFRYFRDAARTPRRLTFSAATPPSRRRRRSAIFAEMPHASQLPIAPLFFFASFSFQPPFSSSLLR
jgi:hypothetical protein